VAVTSLLETLPLDGGTSVDVLLTTATDAGFDLRRPLFLAHVLSVGEHRAPALDLWRRAVHDRRSAGIYGDGEGWLVEVGLVIPLTRDRVAEQVRYVDRLLSRYGGTVRSVAVEDVRRADVWAELADHVREGASTGRLTASQPSLPSRTSGADAANGDLIPSG
jgi:hypothetical protein